MKKNKKKVTIIRKFDIAKCGPANIRKVKKNANMKSKSLLQ